jgi:hypothetical protein
MGTFAEFISSKGISETDILRRSARLERLTSKDRELHRQRETHRREGKKTSYEEAGIPKPRSGRSIQIEHVEAARNDVPLPGPVRTKMLRTIQSLLEGKGGEEVTMPELFGAVPGKQGKKPR